MEEKGRGEAISKGELQAFCEDYSKNGGDEGDYSDQHHCQDDVDDDKSEKNNDEEERKRQKKA